jgi:spore germination protein YaaH
MLNDPAKQQAHIAAILDLLDENGYDGIDIDYEGFMNGYNRDVYAQFITNLSAALKAKHKTLGIAVEAFNTQQNWEAFGKAVDRFEIMGYDYHAAKTTDVGPIGPASWLKDVVDYAATRVPKEKIVLGLGTYGYSWISDGSQYVSTAVSYDDALNIAKDTGSTISHDADGTPNFAYDRGYGQRYLYFEDAQSTKPKLQLAEDSGIAGVAFWRLGTEDPSIWNDVAAIVK